MNRDIINDMTSEEKSSWLQDAKRRKKWGWLRRITLRPHVKYLRIRRAFLLFLHGVIARYFPHKHKWQKRGANRYGTTTYRMCLKCRETQKRVNNINEPDRFETCDPIPDLDSQFDKDDNYIFNGL